MLKSSQTRAGLLMADVHTDVSIVVISGQKGYRAGVRDSQNRGPTETSFMTLELQRVKKMDEYDIECEMNRIFIEGGGESGIGYILRAFAIERIKNRRICKRLSDVERFLEIRKDDFLVSSEDAK
jgi:hypothetical protein